MAHQPFHYRTLAEVETELTNLATALPLSQNTGILKDPCTFGAVALRNRLGISPMEGVDSLPDGAPSELTRERYIKFAEGGAALIWFEAVSIVHEGRSSLKQLYLDRQTLPAFQKLIADMKEAGLKKNGFAPYIIMQANHSGRYSRPNAETKPEPIIAYHRPEHEQRRPVDSSRIATDDYLEGLEEKFGEASELTRLAGFDAVDIKSCHGYLLDELASAYTREGRYGGSFENRFRLMINAVKNAQQAQTKDFAVVARLGIYDGFAYPYGFGMARDGSLTPDYEEPIRLVNVLHKELGMPFINFTMGDPHQVYHVTRPYDRDIVIPDEHPLESVARMYQGCGIMKKTFPSLGVASSAPTYLRQFSPNLAAGAIEQGVCDVACFGRLSFANPNFANEMLTTGTLNAEHTCITCSMCSKLIRAGLPTGCVVRNPQTYLGYYKSLQ
ncbi:MAG: flavin oxidoreductase/NADH oxidase [Negativicutes bacterium]|nr:flavin oxidoreductase/NADH oxidase [Negativicutes bacterium]